jgi:transposase-like protein
MGRKKYNKELKARIALDAIKGQKTIAELAIVDPINETMC